MTEQTDLPIQTDEELAAATEPGVRAGVDGAPPDAADETRQFERPEGLPDKFWDADTGSVRTDVLAKSYRALENRLGAAAGGGIPDDASGYEIDIRHQGFETDPDVNSRLHAAGFSQEQAQLVYDLAGEVLGPMIAQLTADLSVETDKRRLADHFGGEQKWRELQAQLTEWGRARLGEDRLNDLASSYDGVLDLHRMMQRQEPNLLHDGNAAAGALSEQGLRELMRDPRYWRDHEPSIVQEVRDGFSRLYPDPD